MAARDEENPGNGGTRSGGTGVPLRLLVVGAVVQRVTTEPETDELQSIVFANFSDVTTDLVREVDPDVVLSTLIGDHFDALDLACKLVEAGFVGRYRAVTVGLPDPDVIRNEIESVAPNLNFDVFQIDGT